LGPLLDELGVEQDFGVVGEELGDGAAGLGVGGGLVEGFLGGAGNAGGGGQRDLGDGEARVGLGQGNRGVGFDLFRREAAPPNCAPSAMEKQLAWAAAMSSSGVVPESAPSKRVANE